MLLIQGDSRLVGSTHLQGEESQVYLAKAAEHVQKGAGYPVAASVGFHRHVVNVPLIYNDVQARVAQHVALLILGHDKAGLSIKQGVGQHVLRPGTGEAGLLQPGDLLNVTAVHGNDLIIHIKQSPKPFFQAPAGIIVLIIHHPLSCVKRHNCTGRFHNFIA